VDKEENKLQCGYLALVDDRKLGQPVIRILFQILWFALQVNARQSTTITDLAGLWPLNRVCLGVCVCVCTVHCQVQPHTMSYLREAPSV